MNLSGVALSLIRAAETSVFRGKTSTGVPILVVAQNASRAESDETRRLKREYALRDHLRSDWAAVPIEQTSFRYLTALVLADPGGVSMEDLFDTVTDLPTRLRIAIALASVVDRLHADGMIHGDVRPANVLIDLASERAWLIGFGSAMFPTIGGANGAVGDASLAPMHDLLSGSHGGHDAWGEPLCEPAFDGVFDAALAPYPGSLPYRAPELAGSADPVVDWRSDLYGLGITLYRLFAGDFPFRASTPLEWAHCHIARTPAPLHEVAPSLPVALGAIVSRLLAKTPDERYQSAGAVRADLGRCLARLELDASAEAPRFHAASWRAPSRLYGRESELQALLQEFDQVRATGESRCVMIAGRAGVGKSALYNALVQRNAAMGLFLSGKFDQYRRDVPYRTVISALQGLVRQMLSLDVDERATCRDTIREAVYPNGRLLADLIPELGALIGEQPPVGDVPPDDARFRMHATFAQMLTAIARLRGPLVLFIDDLQWIDSGTASLLRFLVVRRAVPSTLLIGAYRDNEIDRSHVWTEGLDAIRASETPLTEIVLRPLAEADIGQLLSDVLPSQGAGLHELTALIHSRTAGNPFYTIQMVRQLAEDAVIGREASTEWDGSGEGMVDFVGYRLKRLDPRTQHVVRSLACLGHEASQSKLAVVTGIAHDNIAQRIGDAVTAGLVLHDADVYRFVHDSVHEAAYLTFEPEARLREHLGIARVLSAEHADTRAADAVFELANHFNIAEPLITQTDERVRVAALNLDAALYAKASSAYASALAYLESGLRFLGDDAWSTQPRLRAKLGAAIAESLLTQGRLDEAAVQIDALREHSTELDEVAQAYVLEITLYGLQSRNADAVVSAIAFLERTGIHINARPTRDEVERAFATVLDRLGGRPIEVLADFPAVEDPTIKAILDVLAIAIVPAFFTDQNLAHVILCEMLIVSIEHGITGASADGIALLGSMLGDAFGDYELGYRFARVGCAIADRREYSVRKAKALFSYELASYWTRPISTALEAVRAAFAEGVRSGDVTMACFAGNHIVTDLLVRGDALDAVWSESCVALEFVRSTSFVDAAKIIIAQQRFIEAMRGNTHDPASFDGPDFDEAAFEADFSPSSMSTMVFWYWVIKGKTRCFGGRYSEALAAFDEAVKFEWASPAHIQLLDFYLFRALALAATYRHGQHGSESGTDTDDVVQAEAASDERKRVCGDTLRTAIARFERWSKACAETFTDKLHLLRAELARVEDRPMDAIDGYHRAAALAREQGAVQFEALALERAALFFDERGYDSMADDHRWRARDSYRRWGAHGKVRALERAYPALSALAEAHEPDAHGSARMPLDPLDVATIVKTSHAVTGEIVVENVIRALLTTAVEHAGAESGMLILGEIDAWRIEAQAHDRGDSIEVTLLGEPLTPDAVPFDLLQTVVRSKHSLIVDDAVSHSEREATRAASTSIPAAAPTRRAVLLVPVIRRGHTVGVVYLEHRAASGAFSGARAAVLEIVAAQAAISLENARLYSDLSQENAQRKRAEATLLESEAFLNHAQRISQTGSWYWDVTADEGRCSEQLMRMFEIEGTWGNQVFRHLLAAIHPDDRARVEHEFSTAFRARAPFRTEYRVALPSGTVRHYQSVGEPDTSVADRCVYMGTVIDLTDRKRGENALREAHAELAHVTRVATLNQLTSSIAHEVSQPLASIVTNGYAALRWLARDNPDMDEVRAALTRVIGDGNRATEVIHRIRDLSRRRASARISLDVNALIAETLELVRRETEHNDVTVQFDPAFGLAPIVADRVQIQQVMINLVVNANQALAGVLGRGREIQVSTAPGSEGRVVVAVKDNGPGVPASDASNLFEPFFTTKHDGLGMGLSICRSIIEAHGGRLWLENRPGAGAMFAFALPKDLADFGSYGFDIPPDDNA